MSTATDTKHIVRDANIYSGKPRIAGQLKLHSIAVLTVRDAGRANQEISDEEQLAFAASQSRRSR